MDFLLQWELRERDGEKVTEEALDASPAVPHVPGPVAKDRFPPNHQETNRSVSQSALVQFLERDKYRGYLF